MFPPTNFTSITGLKHVELGKVLVSAVDLSTIICFKNVELCRVSAVAVVELGKVVGLAKGIKLVNVILKEEESMSDCMLSKSEYASFHDNQCFGYIPFPEYQ